jgi:DNA-binding XRE family transcriptional regulator
MNKHEPASSRKEAGHTQAQAAEMVEVSRRAWQEWEGGRRAMPSAMLRLYRHLAGLERIPFRAVGYARPEE